MKVGKTTSTGSRSMNWYGASRRGKKMGASHLDKSDTLT